MLLDANVISNAKAQDDVLEQPSRAGFAECSPRHLLIIRDEFLEDIFRHLLQSSQISDQWSRAAALS